MKLLFVHDHPFYKHGINIYSGGSFPKSLWNNYLINFGEVTVFGRNANSEKSKVVISSGEIGVNFILTENYKSVKKLFQNRSLLHAELKGAIESADIVLIRLPSVLGFIAGDLALMSNKRIWVEQVGNAKEALGSHGSMIGKFAAPFFELINKRLVKKANFISYVTQTKLQKDYPSSQTAITVSLSDVIIRHILNEHNLVRERFYGNTLKIGLIGGFDARYKGQHVLLKAVSLLPKETKVKIELHLVGKGNYGWILREANELGLKNAIKFIGPLEAGDKINAFLKEMSLYVQPSFTEGMPRAAIEAMSMGCPILGSKVGGLPDIINPSLLHDKGDSEKLSKDIQTLVEDRDLLFSEAHSSLKKAKPFLIEILTMKRLEFYKKMNLSFRENT